MTKIFIDFETRSFADLRAVGAWIYSEHETTDIFCMAWRTEQMKRAEIWVPGTLLPEVFRKKDAVYIARNALFEYAMIQNVAIRKYEFPIQMLQMERWVCTRALSLTVGMPGSLDRCAEALKVGTKKLVVGAHLINKYSKPAKEKKTGRLYFRKLEGEDQKSMYEYCMQDVNADYECYQKIYKLKNNKIERDIFLLDFWQNVGGLPVDVANLDKMIAVLNAAMKAREKEMQETGVNVRSPTQLIAHFAREGFKLNNIQAETIEKLLQNKKIKNRPDLLRLLQLRQFLGKASIKKYKALKEQTSTYSNKIRYILRYFGATTGRWSATGFQPHNLPKTKSDTKIIEENIKNFNAELPEMEIIEKAKIILPGLIKAERGKTFLMGDFSAIEARGIAYLAGQKDLLDMFRQGKDVYVTMASRLYNKSEKNINANERQLGKAVILACGYGMGVNTFIATCQKWGINISQKFAENAVYTYRDTYTKIKNFWYDLENAFCYCHANRKKSPVKKVGEYIEIRAKNGYVAIKLPSGRELFYHNVQQSKGQLSYWNYSRRLNVKLYGGILAENVTQAMCRDILADRMIICAKQKLNPVLHVHDEIVCYINIKQQKEAKQAFKSIMNTAPIWLDNFPLMTEIEISKRYHK